MDRWTVLRNGIVLCKLCTAAWSVLWHSGRQGRFSDGLLYSAGSDPWFVFKEKMWLEYLAWNGDHDCRTYLLCMTAGSLSFQNSDLFVLLCAFLFAIHILVIDHFSPLVDGVRMSCIQFLVAGVLSAFPMFFSEMGHSAAGIAAWLPQFTVMGCMGCNSVCRCDVERCCLYLADYCTEWTESDAGIYDHESGICIFSTCRLGDPW